MHDDLKRWRALVESVKPALSARDLVRRYGGRVMPFRELPPLAQKAILTRAAEHLEPDEKPRINPKKRFGYVEIPMEALQQAVLASVNQEGDPFKTFDDYHRWYVSQGDTPNHTEVWPIEFEMQYPEMGLIHDGSHRFHSYVRSGVQMVPVIYDP